MPRATAAAIGRFLELLDLADAFCREERLLSLARTPEQRRFQRWFLGEFVRQEQGEAAAGVARCARARAGTSVAVSRPSPHRAVVAVVAVGGALGRRCCAGLLGEAFPRRRPASRGRPSRSTWSARSRSRCCPRWRRPPPAARSRSASAPACSAGSPRCRRTPSRHARLLDDGRAGARGGLPARHPGRLPGRGGAGAPALDPAAQRAFDDEEGDE